MARDKGLEELLADELRPESGVTEKAMFGGWAWLVNGNLLCGARDDGMLVRLLLRGLKSERMSSSSGT